MRTTSLALATLLSAAALAGSANAYVLVAAGRLATACYENARDQRADMWALDQCNNAMDEGMSQRDRAGTYVNRGIVLMHRGDYERAMADFDTAIRLQPTLAEGHINRGGALLAQSDYAAALEAINRGLALNPEEPARAYYNRGVAHEELGQIREAYEDYSRAAELAPDWDPPRTELTRFQVRRG